jgi:hypothetical protein
VAPFLGFLLRGEHFAAIAFSKVGFWYPLWGGGVNVFCDFGVGGSVGVGICSLFRTNWKIDPLSNGIEVWMD